MTPESPSLAPPSTRLLRAHAALVAAAILSVAATAAAGAAPQPDGLAADTRVDIARVIDGETLETADGRRIRLVAMALPRSPPVRAGETERSDHRIDRLRAAAHDSVATAIEGGPVTLHFDAVREDRHGRWLAHVVAHGGIWLQARLVAAGLARVETLAETAAQAGPLLRLEAEARAAGRGLWGHPAFRVIAPREAGQRLDTFQIVEGVAQAIEGRRPSSRFALHRDGRSVTVTLNAVARAEWRRAGHDPAALLGQTLRVRGWIRWQEGPRIDVTHAAQIENGG